MTQPTPPDTEAIVVAYLKGVTAVNTHFAGRISTELDPTVDAVPLPSLIISIVSTVDAAHRRLGGYLTQLEAYGSTKEEAFDGAALAAAAMLDEEVFAGTTFAGLGVVTGVENVNGPRPADDPETGDYRYLHDVRVYARPE